MGGDRYEEKSAKPKFAMVYREDLASPEVLALKPCAFRCWVTLRAHIFSSDGYRVYHELLHDFTGYERRTIQRALAELEEAGLLRKEYRKEHSSNKQTGNLWTLLEPPSVAADREAGLVPQQYPKGRREHRPSWRCDRRPGASDTPPIEGVVHAAQQGLDPSESEVSIEGTRTPPEHARRTGRWPGLLRKVSDEVASRTLRTMSQWALAQRAPTRSDVKRRLDGIRREATSPDYQRQVIEHVAKRGGYDFETNGRSFKGLRHAVKSGWSRAVLQGLADGMGPILLRVNALNGRDSKGIIRELRAVRMDAA